MSGYPDKGQGYGGQYQQYGQNPAMVFTSQPTTMTQPTPSNYMALSVFSCLCCVWPIGLAAIIFSSMSSDSARAGDYEGARSKGKVALGLSIASMVLGVVAVVVILAVYFTVGFGIYYG